MIIGFTLMMWGLERRAVATGVHPQRLVDLHARLRRADSLPIDLLVFLEAMIGLGLVALVISYLPSIYGAFARREQLVGLLEARAGSPPTAVEMLTRYSADRRDGDGRQRARSSGGSSGSVDVEESHTSFAALVFFRSPQPERSWIVAAGCVLDTASLVHSTRRSAPQWRDPADASVPGFLCLRRLADYFGIRYDPDPRPDDPISITRRRVRPRARRAARRPACRLKADLDQAWRDFAGWRVNYDTVLIAAGGARVRAPGAVVVGSGQYPRRSPRSSVVDAPGLTISGRSGAARRARRRAPTARARSSPRAGSRTDPGDEHRRERRDPAVVVADVGVVEAACGLDAVLGDDQLALQVEEVRRSP